MPSTTPPESFRRLNARRNAPLCSRLGASSVALATALVATIAPSVAAAEAEPPGLTRCRPPAPGRYALLGSGEQGGNPVAVLMQERWLPDGRIEGVRYRRVGREFQDDRYSGVVKPDSRCWALLERQGPGGVMAESVALDPSGRPRVGLQLSPAGVLSLRYVDQGDGRCAPALLDGLVTSQQQGQSWSRSQWRPNAVVQREWWQGGRVQGWAVASYNGRLERAGYSGRLELGADCLGRMRQRDVLGSTYDYRVLVLANGGGYFYLQSDPDNLTLGLLQRLR
jgi:hypothetical protein